MRKQRRFFWHNAHDAAPRRIIVKSDHNPQFAEFQKENAEVLHAMLLIAFKGIEHLFALNTAAARGYLASQAKRGESKAVFPDADELNRCLGYAKDLHALVGQMQQEILAVMREQYDLHVGAQEVKHRVSSSRYQGTMEFMLESTTQAFEFMANSAKQFSELTTANILSSADSAKLKKR